MTLGSHQRCVGETQSWITPKPLIAALGGPEAFDLDPCASDPQPWPCAKTSWTTCGLQRPWHGRIWLNPPFDRYEVGRWVERLAYHKPGGIALLHARTETEWFTHCWTHARAMLFLAGRLHFYYPDGRRAPANSGAPAVLIAFDREAEASSPIRDRRPPRHRVAKSSGFNSPRHGREGAQKSAGSRPPTSMPPMQKHGELNGRIPA